MGSPISPAVSTGKTRLWRFFRPSRFHLTGSQQPRALLFSGSDAHEKRGPVTHRDQGRFDRLRQLGRRPLASVMPQKQLGTGSSSMWVQFRIAKVGVTQRLGSGLSRKGWGQVFRFASAPLAIRLAVEMWMSKWQILGSQILGSGLASCIRRILPATNLIFLYQPIILICPPANRLSSKLALSIVGKRFQSHDPSVSVRRSPPPTPQIFFSAPSLNRFSPSPSKSWANG